MGKITKSTGEALEQAIEGMLAIFLYQRFGINGNPRAIMAYLYRLGLVDPTALWDEFTNYVMAAFLGRHGEGQPATVRAR